ncbi:MAG: hypothetical protein CVT96_07185 [Bacteroidetes bacterium HGW-Bacteroidetes-13]|nr:MAG: hypothetical protein CVT96_07185 [Bacteroidetes bacterium HGW-Bacteroidetes-13]
MMAMLSQQTKLLIFTTVFFGVFFSHAQETTQTEQTISKAITLDKLMSERISFNKSENIPGRYTVQLYSGNLKSAQEVLTQFTEKFPTNAAVIRFQTPNYKVWIPNLRNKLDAEKLFASAKPDFPNILMFRNK